MTAPESPHERHADGQAYYVEPPIAGMPYNAAPPPAAYFPPPPPVNYYQQPYPYQPPYPYPYGPPGTNGLAIASMVLGILFLYGIGSILALVFGYRARAVIRHTGQSGDGMAIAGIVLGWIGVAFMALALIFLVAVASSYA